MKSGYFITGTDTGVGKTRTSCALLYQLRRQYAKCIGMKPFATGVELTAQGILNEDVQQLRAASNFQVEARLDNPYLFEPAVAPHIAAEWAKRPIEIAHIMRAFQQLAQQADAIVVEGAGGLLVPLNQVDTSADLAQQLGLPVILVVGLKLGCLNHALLTLEALHKRGLSLAGWVANRIDPAMPAAEENLAYLKQQIAAPLLADWAWQPQLPLQHLSITLPPTSP